LLILGKFAQSAFAQGFGGQAADCAFGLRLRLGVLLVRILKMSIEVRIIGK
jgi:hypothetical protein